MEHSSYFTTRKAGRATATYAAEKLTQISSAESSGRERPTTKDAKEKKLGTHVDDEDHAAAHGN